MRQKRLTFSYCFLFGTVLLFAFSGIWHPLLHHTCGKHEKQELSVNGHTTRIACVLCAGLLQSDDTPQIAFLLPHSNPPLNIESVARHCPFQPPPQHAQRAPPPY